MIEMLCVVSGKVQAVRYRDYVLGAATDLGVVGWVRNEPDGTVSVCAQGEPDTLKEMVEYLNEGSLLSEVESVTVEWRSVKETFHDFSMLH
ncbi:MAG: acylphosphatase [Patescibacteria group bacterium]